MAPIYNVLLLRDIKVNMADVNVSRADSKFHAISIFKCTAQH